MTPSRRPLRRGAALGLGLVLATGACGVRPERDPQPLPVPARPSAGAPGSEASLSPDPA